LWRHLRDRRLGGFKFRRQRPIDPYVVDFVCLDAKLIVELDGGGHALKAVQDLRRSSQLQGDGFQVLRFWNSDVVGNLDGVLEVAMAALRAAAPSPRPSPRGEREKWSDTGATNHHAGPDAESGSEADVSHA
jgi:very-short-patch-repair endonuclease